MNVAAWMELHNSGVLALERGAYDLIHAALTSGAALTPGTLRAAAARRPAQANGRNVAVLPLYGLLVPREGALSRFFNGTPLDAFSAAFTFVMNDPNIAGVVIDVDSPGGSVSGVTEAASVIHAARGRKPVAAVANSLAASAAYWLAAQADMVAVTPSGMAGSVGVLGQHTDISRAMDKAGIKMTFISAGRYKTEGNEFEPLSAEARAARQQTINDYYALMVNDIARGRGVAASTVRGGYGEGRLLTAQAAVRAGLADKVATLDAVISDVAAGRVKAGGPKASTQAGRGGDVLADWGVYDRLRSDVREAREMGGQSGRIWARDPWAMAHDLSIAVKVLPQAALERERGGTPLAPGKVLMGFCRNMAADVTRWEIFISAALSPDDRAFTLAHELAHARYRGATEGWCDAWAEGFLGIRRAAH